MTTRKYRPAPLTVRSSTPPLPVVVSWMAVQAARSREVSMRYRVAQDASHSSRTRVTCATNPRSTSIHCGPEPGALAQRVPEFPSTALRVGQHPPDDDAVTGRSWDKGGGAAAAA